MLTFSTTRAEHTHDVFAALRASLGKVMSFLVQFVIEKLNLMQNLWDPVDTLWLFALPGRLSYIAEGYFWQLKKYSWHTHCCECIGENLPWSVLCTSGNKNGWQREECSKPIWRNQESRLEKSNGVVSLWAAHCDSCPVADRQLPPAKWRQIQWPVTTYSSVALKLHSVCYFMAKITVKKLTSAWEIYSPEEKPFNASVKGAHSRSRPMAKPLRSSCFSDRACPMYVLRPVMFHWWKDKVALDSVFPSVFCIKLSSSERSGSVEIWCERQAEISFSNPQLEMASHLHSTSLEP